MPLERCSSNGKSGWKYGDSGHCYTGPGAKKRAVKQGLAENKGNEQKFKQEMAQAGLLDDPDVLEVLGVGSAYLLAVANHLETEKAVAYIPAKERADMPAEDFGDPKRKRYPVKDQKHLDLAWDLSGREAPAAQKAIRQRLREIAKRKGLKLPSTADKK